MDNSAPRLPCDNSLQNFQQRNNLLEETRSAPSKFHIEKAKERQSTSLKSNIYKIESRRLTTPVQFNRDKVENRRSTTPIQSNRDKVENRRSTTPIQSNIGKIENRRSTTPVNMEGTTEHIKKKKRKRGRHRKRTSVRSSINNVNGEFAENSKILLEKSDNLTMDVEKTCINSNISEIGEQNVISSNAKDDKNCINYDSKSSVYRVRCSPPKIGCDFRFRKPDLIVNSRDDAAKMESTALRVKDERATYNRVKVTKKVDNNNRSWLDMSGDEDEDEDVPVIDILPKSVIVSPKSSKEATNLSLVQNKDNNVQLDAYKSRFTFGRNDAKNIVDERKYVLINENRDGNIQLDAYKSRFTFGKNDSNNVVDEPKIDETKCVLNNEKEVKKDAVKIGVNVNKFDDRPKKHDGTKRSRRKTEPFDFELQADGMRSSVSFNDNTLISDSPAHTWEIPSNLCSFLTETTSESKRSLFSGSITDAGLFVHSDISDAESAERDSLQRIFDENYDLDGSDDFDESESSGSGSDDVDFEDSDDGRHRKDDGVLLPPEPQIGNVEYKLKLVNPTKQRFEHLVTQMKWRLREGRGEAVYGIGVRDCGRVRGLPARRLRASLRTLRAMAHRLGAQCALLAVLPIAGAIPPRLGAEVLVRKIPDDQHNIEVRVAVMGSNDAGKSTLVGVLTQGELDNGRGSARLNMFRHLHEVRTGRTSSVSHEALGFDAQGRPINYAYSDLITPEEILEKSSKLVSFIDLAGHRKYLKTTVQGLTGYSPHLAMLVVSATAGVNRMTLEHLALVGALDLPFFVVVTKTDCTSHLPVEQRLRQELAAVGCRKLPLWVSTRDDVVLAASNISSRLAVPIFPVSSVTGQGLDALRWFLFLAPNAVVSSETEQEPVEFQVDETFKVGDSSGPVVAGLLTKGVITERTKLLIGPLDSGEFVPIRVDSLHRNKAPCRVVRAGQAASLGLSGPIPGLRQGMVLLGVPERYRQPNLTQDNPNRTRYNSKTTDKPLKLPEKTSTNREEANNHVTDASTNQEAATNHVKDSSTNQEAATGLVTDPATNQEEAIDHVADALTNQTRRECKPTNRMRTSTNEQCQLSRDKILSDGAWNSEKVSPKAFKKMRKRLANVDNVHCNNKSVDLGVSLKEIEKNSTDTNVSGKLEDGTMKKSKLKSNVDNLRFCDDEIERIINDIDCKKSLDVGTNLKNPVKLGQIDKLSPLSSYAARFTKPAGVDEEVLSVGIAGKSEWDGNSAAASQECGLEGDDKISDEENRSNDDSDDLFEEDPDDPRGCFFFQASVTVLHNSTAIYPGFQATVHIGSIRQTAVIEGILSSRSILRAGERASVLFRFLRHPEYVRSGSGLLLRQALHAKGVGCVTQAFPHRG